MLPHATLTCAAWAGGDLVMLQSQNHAQPSLLFNLRIAKFAVDVPQGFPRIVLHFALILRYGCPLGFWGSGG
jgi:hypothetical protein